MQKRIAATERSALHRVPAAAEVRRLILIGILPVIWSLLTPAATKSDVKISQNPANKASWKFRPAFHRGAAKTEARCHVLYPRVPQPKTVSVK